MLYSITAAGETNNQTKTRYIYNSLQYHRFLMMCCHVFTIAHISEVCMAAVGVACCEDLKGSSMKLWAFAVQLYEKAVGIMLLRTHMHRD